MDDTGNSLPQYEIEINGEIHNLPEYNEIVPRGDYFVVRLDLSPLLGRPAYFTVPFFPAEYLLDARRLVLCLFSLVRLPLLQSAADGLAQRVADYTYDAFLNHDFAASRFLPINIRVLSTGNYSLNVDQLNHVALAVTESLSSFRTVPATKSSVEALEEAEALESGHQHRCVICLEEYNLSPNYDDDDNKSDDHQKALKLPCSHIFHKDCLVRWFQIKHSCPLCRYAMPT